MATYGLTATSQGQAAGDIHLEWTSEPDDTVYVNIYYKTAAWHLWKVIDAGIYIANDFSAAADYTYEFKLWFRKVIAGGETWSETVTCTAWTGSSSEAITLTDTDSEALGFHGAHTETITLTESGASAQAITDGHTETIYLSDSGSPLVSLTSDYQYFFGGYDGQVYAENKAYLSDDGNSIEAFINLKQGDFADQDPKCLDQHKTIWEARLWYVDIKAGATTTLKLSTDGGTTWTDRTVNLGNGDGTVKVVKFYFITTGHTITPRLFNDSIDEDFQWIALQLYYTYAGEYF